MRVFLALALLCFTHHATAAITCDWSLYDDRAEPGSVVATDTDQSCDLDKGQNYCTGSTFYASSDFSPNFGNTRWAFKFDTENVNAFKIAFFVTRVSDEVVIGQAFVGFNGEINPHSLGNQDDTLTTDMSQSSERTIYTCQPPATYDNFTYVTMFVNVTDYTGAYDLRLVADVDSTVTTCDFCAAGPCQNGGSCENLRETYNCTCLDGFEGDECEVDIDDCDPDPCQNDGTCTDGVGGINNFTCACTTGFAGDVCDECDTLFWEPSCGRMDYTDACHRYAGGACEDVLPINTWITSASAEQTTREAALETAVTNCPSVSLADLCNLAYSECVPELNATVNQGSELLLAKPQCRAACTAGRVCADLSAAITEPTCDDMPISTFTTSQGQNTFTCQQFSFRKRVQVVVDADISTFVVDDFVTDFGAAISLSTSRIVVINVEAGSVIVTLDLLPDAAETTDTGKRTSATAALDSLISALQSGSSALRSTGVISAVPNNSTAVLFDFCAPGPCENGGSCENLVTTHNCTCLDGFEGDECEVDIDDCDPNPCQNGGTCTDGIGGINNFTCACLTGFVDDVCDVCDTLYWEPSCGRMDYTDACHRYAGGACEDVLPINTWITATPAEQASLESTLETSVTNCPSVSLADLCNLAYSECVPELNSTVNQGSELLLVKPQCSAACTAGRVCADLNAAVTEPTCIEMPTGSFTARLSQGQYTFACQQFSFRKRVKVVVDGTISTFDVDDFVTQFGAAIGVSTSRIVVINVEAGSVIVTLDLLPDAAETTDTGKRTSAAAAENNLVSALQSGSSTLRGMGVISAVPNNSTAVALEEKSSSSSTLETPVIAGIAAGGVVVLALIAFMVMKNRRPVQPTKHLASTSNVRDDVEMN